MSSYRFCRTDDVGLLVEAYNRCYRVHFDGLPELTVQDFKADIRKIDLWCSSCMVASADRQPIAVLHAAKRDDENLIRLVGVHPEHQRQGHGRHLVDSLSAKLAILGPPRILAEVPVDQAEARAFIEACGFEQERVYHDFEREAGAGGEPPAELPAMPIDVAGLVEAGALDPGATRCWARKHRSLLAGAGELTGLAVATDRIEAFVLYRDGDTREIAAVGWADESRRDALAGLLLRQVGETAPLRFPAVCAEEAPFEALEAWGFRRGAGTIGYATQARPA